MTGEDVTFLGDGVELWRAEDPILRSTDPNGVVGGRTNAGNNGFMSRGYSKKFF